MRIRSLIISGLLLISTTSHAYQVEAENIPSQNYFETTHDAIKNAKSSILLVMYLISISPTQPDSEPNKLVNALIEAKDRGVNVRVILDQNIDFESETNDDTLYSTKNQQAFELLKKGNVPVFFDEAETYTHAKTLIIDNETVILGSTNWSKAALTRNNEASVLIHSKEYALDLLKNLNQIKLQENIPQTLTPSVAIPKAFLTKKLLGEMATHSDERAFDTYLYLLKTFSGNHEGKITVDYENLASSLNIDKMSKEDYRRQINRVLDKLSTKYNLIKFEIPKRNQNTEITIINNPSDPKLEVPTLYWRYGWNNKLSLPAKVLYLINLSYTQESHNAQFSISREKLSRSHGISESFISPANQELRRLNLLDIQYSELEDLKFSQRKANTYTLGQLYDPAALQESLKKLEEKHGKDKLARATQTASIVFEENNLKTIQTFVDLEAKYGEAVMEEASKKISEKNPDNPKRSAGYLINTIKSIGQEKAHPEVVSLAKPRA